jgi:hypothetical protein
MRLEAELSVQCALHQMHSAEGDGKSQRSMNLTKSNQPTSRPFHPTTPRVLRHVRWLNGCLAGRRIGRKPGYRGEARPRRRPRPLPLRVGSRGH